LINYKTTSFAPPLEKIKGYLQTILHISELSELNAIEQLFCLPILVTEYRDNFILPLKDYLFLNSFAQESLDICNEIIQKNGHQTESLNPVFLLRARATGGINKDKEAIKLFQNLLDRKHENLELEIETMARLGMYQIYTGNYNAGKVNLYQSLDRMDSLSSISDQNQSRFIELRADIFECIGTCEMYCGQLKLAEQLYKKVLEIRQKHGIQYKLVTPLGNQGIIQRKAGNIDRAWHSFERARQEAESQANEESLAWINHHCAWLELDSGNFRNATIFGKKSLEIYKKFNNRRGESDCYQLLGRIYLYQGNEYIDKAQTYFNEALKIRQDVDNDHGAASSFMDLASVEFRRRNYIRFIVYLAKSLYLYPKTQILSLSRITRIRRLFFFYK
jgi:tetratricopeptide (TPR) repeat protein